MRKKIKSYVALVITFLLAENEDRQLKGLQQADLAVYLKDFFCQ